MENNAQECLNILAKELLEGSFVDYFEDQNKTNAVITKEILNQYKGNVLRRLLYESDKKGDNIEKWYESRRFRKL